MNIDLLFQIAGVGILVFAVNQVLQKAGREDIAVLASVAGLVVVLFLVVDLVAQLLNNGSFERHLNKVRQNSRNENV